MAEVLFRRNSPTLLSCIRVLLNLKSQGEKHLHAASKIRCEYGFEFDFDTLFRYDT